MIEWKEKMKDKEELRIGDETRSRIYETRIRMTSEITDHHQQKSSKCGFDIYRNVQREWSVASRLPKREFVKPLAEEDSCMQTRSSGLSGAAPTRKDERRLLTAHGCSPRYAVRFETRANTTLYKATVRNKYSTEALVEVYDTANVCAHRLC